MEDATANHNITVAAIDLGSNTFRLLIVRITEAGPVVLCKKNGTVRLASGLTAEGDLAPVTITAALDVLAEFRAELAQYNIDCCRCCGTEALRKAGNAEAFLESAAAVIGMNIEVVSGRTEALLSCRGVLWAMNSAIISSPMLIIDVGGSSTELIYLQEPDAAPLTISLSAGAAYFTTLAATGGLQEAGASFSAKLKGFLQKNSIVAGQVSVVATGGTATALAVLDLGLDHYDETKVQGCQLTTEGLRKILAELTATTAAARDLLPGLEKGRGHILQAGLEIYQEILATIAVDSMIISDAGLLEGIMLSCLEQDLV